MPKPDKPIKLFLPVPEEMYRALWDMAEREERPLHMQAVRVLRAGLKAEGIDPIPAAGRAERPGKPERKEATAT